MVPVCQPQRIGRLHRHRGVRLGRSAPGNRTTKSALLNPLLGALLGSQLNLTAANWTALAQGNVNLLGLLTTLQAQAGVSTPAQALNTNLTLAQVAAALGAQAQAQANLGLAGVLTSWKSTSRVRRAARRHFPAR